MNDKHEPTPPEINSAFKLSLIKDQHVPSGSEVHLDFSTYATIPEGDTITWSIEDFPEPFTIDPKTGVVTGKAPVVELNQGQLVSATIRSDSTGEERVSFFQLEIIGTILLETPEGAAFFAEDKELNFDELIGTVDIQQFIQQLIDEHFAWIFVYDATHRQTTMGKLIEERTAKSGWLIKNYENVVIPIK